MPDDITKYFKGLIEDKREEEKEKSAPPYAEGEEPENIFAKEETPAEKPVTQDNAIQGHTYGEAVTTEDQDNTPTAEEDTSKPEREETELARMLREYRESLQSTAEDREAQAKRKAKMMAIGDALMSVGDVAGSIAGGGVKRREPLGIKFMDKYEQEVRENRARLDNLKLTELNQKIRDIQLKDNREYQDKVREEGYKRQSEARKEGYGHQESMYDRQREDQVADRTLKREWQLNDRNLQREWQLEDKEDAQEWQKEMARINQGYRIDMADMSQDNRLAYLKEQGKQQMALLGEKAEYEMRKKGLSTDGRTSPRNPNNIVVQHPTLNKPVVVNEAEMVAVFGAMRAYLEKKGTPEALDAVNDLSTVMESWEDKELRAGYIQKMMLDPTYSGYLANALQGRMIGSGYDGTPLTAEEQGIKYTTDQLINGEFETSEDSKLAQWVSIQLGKNVPVETIIETLRGRDVPQETIDALFKDYEAEEVE